MLWTIDDFESIPVELHGKQIALIHEDELDRVPDGTELYSIMGKKVIKGVDHIDNDTRGGYLAYGMMLTDKAL